MNFTEYQQSTRATAIYPGATLGDLDAVAYLTLGLTGEAGEIANKVKKVIRDGGGIISDDRRGEVVKEIGDVLWYLARLTDELGFYLEDIADANIEKLNDRRDRGVLQGSGDNR